MSELPISDKEIERLRMLAESLRNVKGSVTANWTADMSDQMLELMLSAVRVRGRRRALKQMWEVEEWLSGT